MDQQRTAAPKDPDLTLPWVRRAFPWMWIALGGFNIAVQGDPALTVGAVVLSRVAEAENVTLKFARLWAWHETYGRRP